MVGRQAGAARYGLPADQSTNEHDPCAGGKMVELCGAGHGRERAGQQAGPTVFGRVRAAISATAAGMTMADTEPTRTLARWASVLTLDDIPAAVQALARLCLLDGLA